MKRFAALLLGALLSFSALPAAAAAVARPLAVEAPEPLKTLLETHLDLARASRLTEDAALDDTEWNRLIAVAPAQARALAETEGYFAAQAEVRVDDDAARTIRLHLVPGAQARIKRLTLTVDGDLDRLANDGNADAVAVVAALRQGWPLPEGARFRNGAWSDAKSQALARLRASGYATALWSGTAAEVDPAGGDVRLFLVVDSGPRFVAGEVKVEGLERQSEDTVRLLAGFPAGTPLTEARLLDWQDRLEKTGLYDQVAITYDVDPAQAGHATVTVHLHEQSLQQSTVAAGISANTGPRITLSHTHRRIFDQPATLRNALEWGRDRQAWEGDLVTHPGENFRSWLLGGAVERLVTAEDVVKSGRLRLGRTQDTQRFERLSFVQAERSVQCNVISCTDARALSVNQHLVWRELDSVILPTAGWSLSLQGGVGQAGGPDSAYGPFTRLYGRATGYWPLGGQWYSQARLELGQVFVSERVAVPDAELFRAGGDDSVRGYPYRSLAPLAADGTIVGGNTLVTTSLEIARPVSASLPSVWWATFIDAGRAVRRVDNLSLALGAGFGIRWRSPVGPLRIDWAWGEELHRGRLHLSVGIAF